MIREVETNKFRKFEVNIGNRTYYVFVEYNEDDFCWFYITKENSAIICFHIGFQCPYKEVYEYINNNIIDLIYDYEEMSNRIEDDE